MTGQETQATTLRLPRELHTWLRRVSFDRNVAMTALVTQALIEKRERMEAES